jgi:hypothetical protein
MRATINYQATQNVIARQIRGSVANLAARMLHLAHSMSSRADDAWRLDGDGLKHCFQPHGCPTLSGAERAATGQRMSLAWVPVRTDVV